MENNVFFELREAITFEEVSSFSCMFIQKAKSSVMN